MPPSLTDKSLATVRTELEYLMESNVITEEIYQNALSSLVLKYLSLNPRGFEDLQGAIAKKGGIVLPFPPSLDKTEEEETQSIQFGQDSFDDSGNSKIMDQSEKEISYENPQMATSRVENQKLTLETDQITVTSHSGEGASIMNQTITLEPALPSPSDNYSSQTEPSSPVGYCRVTSDYAAEMEGDLPIQKNDKLVITNKEDESWWLGYKKGKGPRQAGTFPSNYVKEITAEEFKRIARRPAAPMPKESEKSYQQVDVTIHPDPADIVLDKKIQEGQEKVNEEEKMGSGVEVEESKDDFLHPQPEDEQVNGHRFRDKFKRGRSPKAPRERRRRERIREHSRQFGEAIGDPLLEGYRNVVAYIGPLVLKEFLEALIVEMMQD
ncbi:hypothetical protein CLIB1423_02S06502 [[Candida] railenensis]|uniref:SH3 domain-containing protein n=1 Tax=[Candida] railenensis TaxID=45579 RepID=A0A9P0QKM5_9ASCO|nr:hypothetical protein CLIB1423_02S06502 [[Candida] railenensis]